MKKKLCWALLSPTKKSVWKFLFSKAGAERNAKWYGDDRVVPVRLNFHAEGTK